MYRPRQSFNKIKVGTIITTVGSIFAIFLGLFYYFVPTQLFTEAFAELGYSLDPDMLISLRESGLWMIIGGCISFLGSLFARSNPLVAGVVAITGSIVGGLNIITIVGGIFLLIGARFSRPPAAGWGTTSVPMQGAQVNSTNLKRCPKCSAQMAIEAKFCPNCGDPFV